MQHSHFYTRREKSESKTDLWPRWSTFSLRLFSRSLSLSLSEHFLFLLAHVIGKDERMAQAKYQAIFPLFLLLFCSLTAHTFVYDVFISIVFLSRSTRATPADYRRHAFGNGNKLSSAVSATRALMQHLQLSSLPPLSARDVSRAYSSCSILVVFSLVCTML